MAHSAGSRARLQQDGARFRALERVAWYTTDLTELVARSGTGVREGIGRPDPAFAEPLAGGARPDRVRDPRRRARSDEADTAIAAVEQALDASRENPSHVAVTSAALVALRGIVESERRATADIDTKTGPFGSGVSQPRS